MNPTAAAGPPDRRVPPNDAAALGFATDPRRPAVAFAATIRHPAPFRAALAGFLRTVRIPARPTPRFPRNAYAQARAAYARDLTERDPDIGHLANPVAAIATVAADAWIIEGYAADQSAYARLSVPFNLLDGERGAATGTTGVAPGPNLDAWLDRPQSDGPTQLRHESPASPREGSAPVWPQGWARGFAGIQAAMSLPMRRIVLDRAGLFGLLTALGPARRTRASRRIAIDWGPGQGAMAQVGPGSRPVRVQARADDAGSSGTVRVAVGHGLAGLAGSLAEVDQVELYLLGPGLPSFWLIGFHGIRLMIGLPSWTPDGRWGSLSLDPIIPPVDSAQALADQVAASFATHPAQTRAEVVERCRSNAPEVAAILSRYASLGQILAEPETGLFRWRPAFGAAVPVLDDPEPAEVTAARAIRATTSIQITRDAPTQLGAERRVEGLILDRPVTITLDAAGWLRRGHCTCSHHLATGLAAPGPCRHLLALQAHTPPHVGTFPERSDLATWLSSFPAPLSSP